MVPEFDHIPPHADPLLEEGIRMAANSFAANAGLGGDNIAGPQSYRTPLEPLHECNHCVVPVRRSCWQLVPSC